MSTTPQKYVRLTWMPGYLNRAVGVQGQQLWLGTDHLLVVYRTRYREEYKRFYFADIQAIAVHRTSMWGIVSAVLGALALAIGAYAAYYFFGRFGDDVAGGILVTIAGVFMAILVVHVVLGPTCACRLYTAIHDESLFSISRLSSAQRVLARLQPAIEAFQGALADDALSAAIDSGGIASAGIANERRPSRELSSQPPPRTSGYWHAWLFGFLFVDAIACAIELAKPNLLPPAVGYSILAVELVFMVAALIKQTGTDMPRELRMITWGTFAYTLLFVGLMFVMEFMYGMSVGGGSVNDGSLFSQSNISLAWNVVSIVFDLALGIAGFMQLRAYWREGIASSAPNAPVE